MTHGSLFSGIGGFDLAAQWMGWENIFQVEIDEDCHRVLNRHFPNVNKYRDIKKFDGTKYTNCIDVLTGGFPCQPFSDAGSKKGKNDDRYLWPEMLRIIREIKPAFIVPENVNGIRGMVEQICSDLENEGYTVEPVNIASGALGFDNLRERYWFVAYTSGMGREYLCDESGAFPKKISNSERPWSSSEGWIKTTNELDTLGNTFLRFEKECGEPAIFRMADGLPKRLDVARRLKQCGNAINPRVAFELFKAIELMKNIFPKAL